MELNKVYCMDNLELLKQMKNESVDLIYCDILYNTGKKFKDYDDNLGTPQEAIETEYNYRKGKKNTKKVEKVDEKVEKVEEKAKCPECGAELWNTGGCNVCSSCGWSKCN